MGWYQRRVHGEVAISQWQDCERNNDDGAEGCGANTSYIAGIGNSRSHIRSIVG